MVGDDIIRLPRSSHHRTDGALEQEPVEWVPLTGLVQVPSPDNFRAHHAVEPLGIEVKDIDVVEDHGAVDNPPQLRSGGADFGQEIGYFAAFDDVAGANADRGAQRSDGRDSRLVFGADTSRAARQNEMARTRLCQETGDVKAKAGGSAGNQIAPLLAHQHRRTIDDTSRRRVRSRAEHELSRVTTLRHRPKRLGCCGDGADMSRYWPKLPGIQHRQDFGQPLAGSVRTTHQP